MANPLRAESIDFIRDVVPSLTKAGCNAGKCHGSFQGRGGFRLSLLGFDPEQDYEALVKESRGRRISLAAPQQSLILRKPLGLVPHGGGRRFSEQDRAFQVLQDWIVQGACSSDVSDLEVEKLVVEPVEAVLGAGEHANLRVAAHWSDGVVRDVSRWALYEIREDQYAEVNHVGRVEAKRPGRTAVTVTFMGQVGAVTITIPNAKPSSGFVINEKNYIDRIVAEEWRKVGVRPTELSDDYEFARRVYLDIIGTLPTPDEVREFAASAEPTKRSQLIDQLLDRPEYVDHWASKWADLLRVHRRYVGEKGLWTFWNWVRQAMRENWPVDQLTRDVLASRGSLFTNGATAYYYVDTKPDELAETTSQLFLGIRMQCAKCHHHPYEVWSQEDYYGLANCFTRIELKDNKDNGRFGGAKLLRPLTTENRTRRVKMKTPPKVFGHEIDPETTDDVRVELANWIVGSKNFSRNFANRYWAYFMGRGLVEPIDDLRATNPPSIPSLLNALSEDLIKSGYDLKHLIRTICNSHVYQLASEAAPERDQEGMFYTHHPFRRMPAAVMLDAVNQATECSEQFEGIPVGTRAISLPDPAIKSYFLTAFGRSQRNSPCECATSNAPDLAQSLHLINGKTIDEKVASEKGRLARILKIKTPDANIIDELYLASLSRPPTSGERDRAAKLVATAPTQKEGFEDLLWTLLNCTEFVFNH